MDPNIEQLQVAANLSFFHFDAFRGKQIVLWVDEPLHALFTSNMSTLRNVPFLVSRRELHNVDLTRMRLLKLGELVQLSKEHEVVVVCSQTELWTEAQSFCEEAGILDLVPLSMLKYRGRFTQQFLEVLKKDVVVSSQKDSKTAILIRGKVDPFFTQIVCKLNRIHYPNTHLCLSTWIDTPSRVLDRLDVDEKVLCDRPDGPGMSNVNYQISNARSGLESLGRQGFERVLVQRTDQALFQTNLLERCAALLEEYPARGGYLKQRILTSDLYFRLNLPYHPSDMFMYGDIQDLLSLWSCPFDERVEGAGLEKSDRQLLKMFDINYLGWNPPVARQAIQQIMTGSIDVDDFARYEQGHVWPETLLGLNLLRRVGYPIAHSLDDWRKVIRDMFLIRDTRWWKLFWFKPKQWVSGVDYYEYGNHFGFPSDCLTQSDWEDLVDGVGGVSSR